MKTQNFIRVGVIRPVKKIIAGRTIKATDRAQREALFGMGNSRRRMGRLHLGTIDGQPLMLACELQTAMSHGDHGEPWVITGAERSYALIGNAMIYNDVGYGAASLGVSIDKLKEIVRFEPDATLLAAATRNTEELATASHG